MSHANFEARVRAQYDALSSGDRKLADVLVAHKKNLLNYSATELAVLAGVSKSTTARFFQRLGYESYASFRAELRNSQTERSPLFQLESASPTGRSASKSKFQQQFSEHVKNDATQLATLAETLTDRHIQNALQLLKRAEKVWVVGYRNSYTLADYACALLSQIRPAVQPLNDGSERNADILANVSKADLLVAVDMRRRTRRLSKTVNACVEAGASVLLITDDPISAVSTRASTVLHCPSADTRVFDSYVPAVSLINFIASMLTLDLGKPARARLKKIESMHVLLDDLDSHD